MLLKTFTAFNLAHHRKEVERRDVTTPGWGAEKRPLPTYTPPGSAGVPSFQDILIETGQLDEEREEEEEGEPSSRGSSATGASDTEEGGAARAVVTPPGVPPGVTEEACPEASWLLTAEGPTLEEHMRSLRDEHGGVRRRFKGPKGELKLIPGLESHHALSSRLIPTPSMHAPFVPKMETWPSLPLLTKPRTPQLLKRLEIQRERPYLTHGADEIFDPRYAIRVDPELLDQSRVRFREALEGAPDGSDLRTEACDLAMRELSGTGGFHVFAPVFEAIRLAYKGAAVELKATTRTRTRPLNSRIC
jgi:hypothetical protein